MLTAIKTDIKKDYYDSNYHGINLEEHFRLADQKIKEASSLGQMFGVIAQALIDFNDSHLYFIPPGRANRYDYGWQMAMIGDKCFVTGVKPGSDAAAKGLKAGDEIYSIDGYEPTRDNQWKMLYSYFVLRPKAGVRLVVIKPDGKEQQLDVMTKITEGKRITDLAGGTDLNAFLRDEEDADRERRNGNRLVGLGDELMVWKMDAFEFADAEVDSAFGKFRKYKSLVLDLRGNGGGAESTMLRMISNLFDHDVTLGEIKRRTESKTLVAKTRGGDSVFKGNVVVLIDSKSGSAAELLARVIQIEKRGAVVGDRSAGAVMRARIHSHESGVDIVAFYAASVTDADVIMSDGHSLERVGVEPDHPKLPTAADLAAGRDPVLAYAASLVGFNLDPEKAGSLFPARWKD
ncbi:MAG TPA: S41 family peptidase [Pyrinomonadaceae bacterium]|nr:S41 family peptidase [Pyrinomonadaceae bacterium]